MTRFLGDLDGAVAVVTGAGSGIGRAAAHAFARRGMRVAVTDVDRPRADRVVAEIAAAGGTAIALACDVTSLADLERARDATLQTFARVDLVMNNVGVLAMGPPSVPRAPDHGVVEADVVGELVADAVVDGRFLVRRDDRRRRRLDQAL